MKNTCSKTRPITNPYEVWQSRNWKWLVLKKYQADDSQPSARWFCYVSSPYSPNSGEYNDCYCQQIIAEAKKIS